MNEPLSLFFALIAGFLLGIFFFAGLWWTIRKLESTKQVALWFTGSLLLRTGIVLSGFFFILGDSWQRLLVGLLGFIIARTLVIRLTRPADRSNPMTQESEHAS